MNLEITPKFTTERGKLEKAIVTGGTEGIGKAIALEIAEQNHNVVICARTQARLTEISEGSKIEAIQLDLGDTEKIENFVKQGSEKMGGGLQF